MSDMSIKIYIFFISSPEPKAHRWAYRILMVWRPFIGVRRPQCSKIFFSKTACPIKAKFYMEPPWVGGTEVCSRHLGHMTMMVARPIYGKNPSKIYPIPYPLPYMSREVRKSDFCICENKDADQLRGYHDLRLCFRYTDSTIPLLPKSKVSSL